jgi:hypothetical protein
MACSDRSSLGSFAVYSPARKLASAGRIAVLVSILVEIGGKTGVGFFGRDFKEAGSVVSHW